MKNGMGGGHGEVFLKIVVIYSIRKRLIFMISFLEGFLADFQSDGGVLVAVRESGEKYVDSKSEYEGLMFKVDEVNERDVPGYTIFVGS
ncbi:hypothetical protein L1887_35718 [Cichorium endivia]|nr:hypothetical protein L1887_35718 [Cichorium endivia]